MFKRSEYFPCWSANISGGYLVNRVVLVRRETLPGITVLGTFACTLEVESALYEAMLRGE